MKISKAQQQTVLNYYKRNPDGAQNYKAFRRRWHVIIFGDGAIGAQWLGMFIGIEKDGHGHS